MNTHPAGCHCATCGANRNPHGFAYFMEEFSEPPSDEALAWFREHQRRAVRREDARYRNRSGQLVTVSGVGTGVFWQTWPADCEPPDPNAG